MTTPQIDGLLEPTGSQHQHIERAVRVMTRNDLEQLVLTLLKYLDPVARSAFIELAGERPFRDGRRPR